MEKGIYQGMDQDTGNNIDKEKNKARETSQLEISVSGESIGIKEGERIGLGLRTMQTKAEVEKRKKKRRKRIGITLLIVLILICDIAAVYLKRQAEADADTVESSEAVAPGENQELVWGEITSIRGNEITYDLVAEDTASGESIPGTDRMPDIAEGSVPNEKAQDAAGGNEQDITSGIEQDNTTGNKQGIADGNEQGITDGNEQGIPEETMQNTGRASEKTYHSLGKEPVEVTIPVGTDVVTKLGTTTTFVRLATGDVVQMLMEKAGDGEEIVKMWIVG